MSYYDFEHFWSPHELCQKQENAIVKDSVLATIISLFYQIYQEFFPIKNIQKDKLDRD